MSLLRFIPLVIILLIGFRSHAVIIPHQPTVLTGSMTYGSTFITPPGWGTTNVTDLTRKGVITLGVDHHYLYAVNQSVTEVTLDIVPYVTAGGSPGSTITKVLKVSYYPIDSLTYVDEHTVTIDNVEQMDITITQVKVNGVIQSPIAMPANLYLQGDVFVDRIYDFTPTVDFDDYNLIVASTDWNSDCDIEGLVDEATISWDPVEFAEEYQLEWTFINTVGVATGDIPNLEIDFRNNSTRISTSDLSYKVALRYDQGVLVFRVRAVGRSWVTPYNFLYSTWSTSDGTHTLGSVPATAKKETEPFDIKKNWQYSATYAEEGKKKEVLSFYDGSLRNRQMVTKISTDHNTIVGETIYDHQGRPVIQVLPVPAPDPTTNCSPEVEENSLRFFPNFNKNSGNNGYSKTDFDITSEDGCNPLEVGTMSDASGAANYYSTSNGNTAGSQGYVPDANGYPFSQVEYMPDNTGRIRTQGGVGKEFQLATDEPSHATQYFYAHPFQEQLDRLFGSEVGDASHYQKNMVVDPNGQVSVSYLDQEGRVIATSLAGEAPDNLLELPSAAAIAPLTVDLFAKDANGNSTSNKLSFDGMSKEFNQTISLSAQSDVTITYDIQVPAYTTTCLGSLCLNCVYDLSIEVRDLCGQLKSPIALSPRLTGRFNTAENGAITFKTDCATYNYNTSFTIENLPVGTYQISKILTVNQDALESYLQQYTDPSSGMNTCFDTYAEILEEVATASNIDDCSDDLSCAQCVTNLGTLLQYTQGGGTEAAYYQELAECNQPCKGASYYENMRDILMMDVRPDGQYGQYLNNQGAVSVGLYPLSVLNAFNELPRLNANWTNPQYDVEATVQPYYFNEDGVTRSRIPLTDVVLTGPTSSTPALSSALSLGTNIFLDNTSGEYYTYPQYLNSVTDFISYYHLNPQWANSLVQWHPEYPYLKKYKEYYVKANPSDPYSSESFDQYMVSINTWNDAQTAGFINGMTGPVNDRVNHFWDTPLGSPGSFLRDPYAQITPALNAKIANYATINGVNYSMMQVAAMMNRGNNNLMGTVPGPADLDLFADFAGYSGSQNTELRNAEWMTFRGLYLAAKQELQSEAVEAIVLSSDPGYNGCIGNDSFNPFDVDFIDVNTGSSPFFTGNFFDDDQPCSFYTLGYYLHKQPRFGNQLANVNQDPSQVAYQVYLQTGQCPIALSLQKLLNEAASDHTLASLTSFSATNTLNSLSGLVLAMQNFETPASVPSLTWQPVTIIDASTLEVSLEETATSSVFGTFQLVKASGSLTYNWSDVVSFNNLQFTEVSSGIYEFTVTVKVMIGGELKTQYLTGETTFKIGNCAFPDVCKLNDFGKTLQNVMKSLAQMNTIQSTSYVDLTAVPYNTFLNNSIKYTVNPTYTGAALKWKYNSAIPGFELTDGTKTITIKITGTDPSTFNLASLSTIDFVDEVRAGANNTMEVVCHNSLNNYLVTLSCELLRSDNVMTPVGECGLDDAILCTGLEYDTYDDLMALLELSLETQNAPFNLYNPVLWTSALTEQLPTEPTSVTGTVLAGIVSESDSLLTYNLPGDCDLVLTYSGSSSNFDFDNIVSVDEIVLMNQTVYGSFNDFKLYITYSYGGNFFQDSITGTSCFKLKKCTACTQTPGDDEVSPATSEQTDGIVDFESLNPETLTEIDNNSELYCLDLYEDYISLINKKTQEMLHAGCTTVNVSPAMLTYEEFITNGYCCEDNFLGVINYFKNLYSTATGSCTIPGNYFYEGVGYPTTCSIPDWENASGGFCGDIYTRYLLIISNFNSSPWAIANGVTLGTVSSSAVKCRCYSNYSFYLFEYLSADADENLSRPLTITEYCGILDAEPTNSCNSQYDQYVSCTNYFNDNSGSTDLPIVDYDVFMENELCYCVDEYCSNLSLILSHLAEDEGEDLLVFCLSGREVPCVMDTPTVHFETFEITFLDPCTEFYQSNNEVNAQIQYNQQIQDYYTQLGAAYIAHCMKATEGMTMDFNEMEHHFTLYYYDQAGNLIKTIPPEGVELVNIGNTTIRNAIKSDRLNNTHNVITSHRMPTTYLYNSLNQLVAQNMPDQDAMKVFEPTLPNGLPVGLTTTGIQMVDANQGYLSGYMDATGTAPLINRGYLFKTTNGGLNWVRITNTLGVDLKEVYMVSSTVGYALGSYGLSLITKDGGVNWDLTDMLNTTDYAEYVAMEVVGTDAYILHKTGRIYKINSSGVSSVYKNTAGTLSGYTIPRFLDFTLQGNVANMQGIIYMCQVNDGTESFEMTVITTNSTGTTLQIDKATVGDLNALSFYSATDGVIGGADGNISTVSGSAPASYRQRLRASNAKGLIDQIYMLNANVGIARVTENGVNVIRKTTNAGAVWTALSNEYTNANLSFNRRSGSNLEVLVQGYEAGTAYSKNIVINSSGVCVELDQNPTLLQNLNMKIVSTYNDGTNLTYYGLAQSGSDYVLYKSNSFTAAGTNVTFTPMATVFASSLTPKEMVVMKSGSEIAVEVLTTSGVIYRSQSSTAGSVMTFTTFTISSGALTSFVSIDKITISSLDYIVAYRSSDTKIYGKAATAASGFISYSGTLTLGGSVITKIGVHGTYITLVGTNGGIFTASGVVAPVGTPSLTYTDRKSHQLYGLTELKYTSSMNLIVGQNGVALTRPVSLSGSNTLQLRPVGITSDLCAASQVTISSTNYYAFGGKDGALAMIQSSGSVQPAWYTTNGTTVTDHLAGKTINDISSITYGGTTKVVLVGDNGSLYYTGNIVTDLFTPAIAQTTQNFLGVFQIAATEKSIVVGNGTEIFRFSQNTGMRINRVFGPKYNDVHFENGQYGTLIGDYYLVRSTLDGGLSWNIIKSTTGPGINGLKKVWTKSKPNGQHFAVIGGVNYYLRLDNGTVTQTVLAGTANDIQFSKTNPLLGYIAYNNTLAKVTLAPTTYTISLSSVYTAANPIRGIHVFDNTSAIMVGDAGGIYYYRNDGVTIPPYYTLATVSGVAFKDVAFIDNKIGLAVGDAGKIYSLFSSNNHATSHDIESTGFSATAETVTDPESGVTPALYNITALAFTSTNTAVYGGGFISPSDVTSRAAMVRNLKYEDKMFTSRFYYDRLGRIVVSQNSRQKGANKYSYTQYDALGRATEAGEKTENGGTGKRFAGIFGTLVGGTTVPNVVDDANMYAWLNYTPTTTRKEVTKSYYDATNTAISGELTALSTLNANTQRKRIVHVTYSETYSASANVYDHATHYDYDIHGNVKTLYQDNRLIKDMVGIGDHRLKKMSYIYDLISGNAHRVDYQTGQSDQWHHVYEYDADNRITDAYSTLETPLTVEASSISSVQNEPEVSTMWDREANYQYYEHGPLARTVLGDQEVQGTDYVYTLQGWIKGVNSNTLDINRDPGQDGAGLSSNNFVARDVYGYSLHYFDDEYGGAIGGNNDFVAAHGTNGMVSNSEQLYNGNIGRMVTTITDPDTRDVLPLGNAYRYDQLNCLKEARSFNNINLGTNSWNTGGTTMYYNAFDYDANGNIIHQVRQDETGAGIDNMTYYYENTAGAVDSKYITPSMKVKRNRLRYVNDVTNYDANDINPGQAATNYQYDAEGRLTVDAQENLAFNWRVDGKVKSVISSVSTKKNISFDYDAMGHRIAKHISSYGDGGILEKSIYYILDAQGNVMSTYERAINSGGSSVSYTQTEKHIYGSSRVGVHNERIELLGTLNDTYSMASLQHHIGDKTYELTNHLGNVLSVISDKIVPEEDPNAPVPLNSVYFDGVDDHGVTATFAAGLGTAISMECWVKTTTSGSTRTLGAYYNGSGGVDKGAALILTAAGKVSIDGRNGTGVYRSSGVSTVSVNDGNWHHVAGTVSGGIWKIYVDGVLENSATVTSGTFSGMNQPFYLGRNMYGGFFQGNLREMSVWNYEKTGTQINSDMGTIFTGSETGLVGYWPMTSSGTPGNDVSTANHDATMTNGPVPATDPDPVIFLADIRQATDYSPFGVILHNRDLRLTDPLTSNLVARGHYGYQGSEMDNELKQDGNSYTTFFRILDPRLGRWLSLDPKFDPSMSPYNSMDNNPILLNDVLGDYTKKRADRMAARAEARGYTTRVFESRKKPGDYGIYFEREVGGTKYYETYYSGKFKGARKTTTPGIVAGDAVKIPDLVLGMVDWITSKDWVYQNDVKVTLGVQAGVSLQKKDSDAKLDLKANLISVELFSLSYDATEIFKKNPDFSFNYIGKDSKFNFSQGFQAEISAGNLAVGGHWQRQFYTFGSMDAIYGESSDYGKYFFTPLLKNKTDAIIKKNNLGQFKQSGILSSPKLKQNIQREFVGIDFTGGAAFFIGFSGRVRLGYYR